MSRPKKDRPDQGGGWVKLQRRLIPHLLNEECLSRELTFFYLQVLAAARFGEYPGTLGWIGKPWSFRDIAECCCVDASTALRNVKGLSRLGYIKRCKTDDGKIIWQLTKYMDHTKDDE